MQDGDHTDGHYITLFVSSSQEPSKCLLVSTTNDKCLFSVVIF